MINGLNKKELEQKASFYHQDGILDIALGLMVLLVWLFLHNEGIQSLIPIYIVLWLPLMKSLKRLVTVPRMAYVATTHSAIHENKNQNSRLVILTAVALFFILGIFVYFNPNTTNMIEKSGGIYGAISLVMTLILAFAGWVNEIGRFIAYTALALLFWFIGLWSGYSSLLLILLGAIILVSGLLLLWQFVHRYPGEE